MTAFDRLANIPPLLLLGILVALLAVSGFVFADRFAIVRDQRRAARESRRQMGYAWAWREFWFQPRQRKLPPPPKRD